MAQIINSGDGISVKTALTVLLTLLAFAVFTHFIVIFGHFTQEGNAVYVAFTLLGEYSLGLVVYIFFARICWSLYTSANRFYRKTAGKPVGLGAIKDEGIGSFLLIWPYFLCRSVLITFSACVVALFK